MKSAVVLACMFGVVGSQLAYPGHALAGPQDPFLKQRRDQAAARKAEYREEREHMEVLEERRREREFDHPEMIFDEEDKPESLAPPPPPE